MTTPHEKTSPRTSVLSRLRRPAALGAASAAAAVELYQEWGTTPWLPSAHCWG